MLKTRISAGSIPSKSKPVHRCSEPVAALGCSAACSPAVPAAPRRVRGAGQRALLCSGTGHETVYAGLFVALVLFSAQVVQEKAAARECPCVMRFALCNRSAPCPRAARRALTAGAAARHGRHARAVPSSHCLPRPRKPHAAGLPLGTTNYHCNCPLKA